MEKNSDNKRVYESAQLISPEEIMDLLKSSYKKQKVAETPSGLKDHNTAPVLHSVPQNMVPIIQPPLSSNDFFSDISSEPKGSKVDEQIDGILRKFPPPIPPYLPNELASSDGGIMIPFIYPPPPVIDRSTLPYAKDLPFSKTKNSAYLRKDANRSPLSEPDFVQLPPLPFPPPNYMPYPLISDESSLTPHEVFGSLLEASKKLPRTDMVLASAAGSLLDLKSQADEEGFTIRNFEEQLRSKGRHRYLEIDECCEDNFQAETGSSSARETEEYIQYARNIDTNDEFDYYYKDDNYERSVVESTPSLTQFIRTIPRFSNIRGGETDDDVGKSKPQDVILNDESAEEQHDEKFLSVDISLILMNTNREIATSGGNNKEKRRQKLLESLSDLQTFQNNNKNRVYLARRAQLLKRLQSLKECKISENEVAIKDQEFYEYLHERELQRDEDLIVLKLSSMYASLKDFQQYYNNCNRAYAGWNSVALNKLKKLKSFFELQSDLFNNLLKNSDDDSFNIESKESGKMAEIPNDQTLNEIKNAVSMTINEDITNHSNPSKAKEPIPSVHDFMNLISQEEFNLITGEAPSNSKTSGVKEGSFSSGIKNQIFQNPLYDATSGSDTNTSDGGTSTPTKRRGRRGGNSAATDRFFDDSERSKHTESALLAKIMKQFSGPQAANATELVDDLESLGINTRWPVSNIR